MPRPLLGSLTGSVVLALSALHGKSADFDIGISSAEPGSRVLLPVTLSGPTAPVAMQFDVLYGSENLASEPIVKGPATFAHTVKSTVRSDGRRRVLIYSAPVSEIPDGVIIEIPFTLEANARGQEAVSLDQILIATANASPLPRPSVTPGRVDIDTGPEPEGGPRLTGLSVSADGTFSFDIVGPEGADFEVQVSGDLVSWTTLTSTTVADGVAPVADPDALTHEKRFYRVVAQ